MLERAQPSLPFKPLDSGRADLLGDQACSADPGVTAPVTAADFSSRARAVATLCPGTRGSEQRLSLHAAETPALTQTRARHAEARLPSVTPALLGASLLGGCAADTSTLTAVSVALPLAAIVTTAAYSLGVRNLLKAYLDRPKGQSLGEFIESHYPRNYYDEFSPLTRFLFQTGITTGVMIGPWVGALLGLTAHGPDMSALEAATATGIFTTILCGIAGIATPPVFYGAIYLVVNPVANLASDVSQGTRKMFAQGRAKLLGEDNDNRLEDLLGRDAALRFLRSGDENLRGRYDMLIQLALHDDESVRDSAVKGMHHLNTVNGDFYGPATFAIKRGVDRLMEVLSDPKTPAAKKAAALAMLDELFGKISGQETHEILVETMPLLWHDDGAVRQRASGLHANLVMSCSSDGRKALEDAVYVAMKITSKNAEYFLSYILKMSDHLPELTAYAWLSASFRFVTDADANVSDTAIALHRKLIARIGQQERMAYVRDIEKQLEKIPKTGRLKHGQKLAFLKLAGLARGLFPRMDMTEKQSVIATLAAFDYAFEAGVIDGFLPLIAPGEANGAVFVKGSHRKFLEAKVAAFTGRDVVLDEEAVKRSVAQSVPEDEIFRTFDRAFEKLFEYKNRETWQRFLSHVEVALTTALVASQRKREILAPFVKGLEDSRPEVREYCAQALKTLVPRVFRSAADRKHFEQAVRNLGEAAENPEIRGLCADVAAALGADPKGKTAGADAAELARLAALKAAQENATARR